MRGSSVGVLAALLAASCSGAERESERLESIASAVTAPTKIVTFTTGASPASDAYGAGGAAKPNDGWVELGSRTVFVGHDVLHGKEPWVTDGTAGGTFLLADGSPGPYGGLIESSAAPTFVTNGSVAVYASGADNGWFAWRTDGTPPGTYPLRKIPLTFGDFNAAAAFGGSIYVAPNESQTLWKTNGTDTGTTAFWTGSYVYGMAAATTKLFLSSNGLYVTNGSTAPAKIATSPSPTLLTAVGDVAYYASSSASAELWMSDGLTASLVFTLPGKIHWLRPFGAGVLFYVEHSGVGWELWKSDGTTTELVSAVPAAPTSPTVVGANAFFAAGDPAVMWITDGTTMGTKAVTDSGGSSPTAIVTSRGATKYKDGVAFSGELASVGREPFFTNGTPAGTLPIADLAAGSATSSPYAGYHEGAAQTLFFSAPPAGATKGMDLWKSSANGIAALVKSIDAPTAPVWPFGSTVLGNKLYFTSREGATSRQLWVTDGTVAGTTRVTTASERTNVDLLAAMGNKVFFTATTDAEGTELWMTDGTEAGTSMIDVNPGYFYAYPYELTPSGTHLFFTAQTEATGREAYAYSDADGLVLLGDLYPGGGVTGPGPGRLTAYKDGVLFAHGSGQWFSDGTVAGTVKLADKAASGTAVRLGNDAIYSTGYALWKTDGTAANTASIKSFSSAIDRLVVAGGYVYFAQYDELWRSDGTTSGTNLVVKLGVANYILQSKGFFAIGNKIAFVVSNLSTGDRWYVSDGTKAGTVKLAEATPGECRPYSSGTMLYFCAADSAGEELWISNGTPGGTLRWMDLNPGPARSAPDFFAIAGTHLFFTAYEGVVPSLYSVDAPTPTPGSSSGSLPSSSSGSKPGGSSSSSTGGFPPAASSSGDEPAAAVDGESESGCGCRLAAERERKDRPSWTAAAVAAFLLASLRRRRAS